MKVKHVRLPAPPWWPVQNVPSCGREVADPNLMISREDLLKIHAETFPPELKGTWKTSKQISAAKSKTGVCLRCWTEAVSLKDWTQNPVGCLGRQMDRVSSGSAQDWMEASGELRAIEELIARHRAEFDQLTLRHRGFIHLGMTDAHRYFRILP